MNNEFYEYLLHVDAKEANRITKENINKLSNANYAEQREIIAIFIELLSHKELYSNFAFGEIVQFFLCDYDGYTQKEKEQFIKYTCNNLEYIINSKDENLPYFLLRFIEKHVDKKTIQKYCNYKLDSLDNKKMRFIDFLFNGMKI